MITLQDKVLNFLNGIYPKKQDLVTALIADLNIGKSTVYKKLSGQVALSIEDLEILAQKYSIPISTFLGRPSDNIFHLDAIEKIPRHPVEYLQNISNVFGKYVQYDDIEFIFISNEIAMFHLLQFPALITLKLYIWDVTNWKTEYSDDRAFSIRMYNERLKEFEEAREGIIESYLKIQGIEIWNIRFLDTLIEQIRYVLVNGLLTDKSEINILKDQLRQLFNYLERSAKEGLKYSAKKNKESIKNEISIYNNQVIDSTNLIYGQSAHFSSVYMIMDSPNYMNCISPSVANLVKKWLDQVLIHSFKISREGKSERMRFFRELKSRLNFMIGEIDKINI